MRRTNTSIRPACEHGRSGDMAGEPKWKSVSIYYDNFVTNMCVDDRLADRNEAEQELFPADLFCSRASRRGLSECSWGLCFVEVHESGGHALQAHGVD